MMVKKNVSWIGFHYLWGDLLKSFPNNDTNIQCDCGLSRPSLYVMYFLMIQHKSPLTPKIMLKIYMDVIIYISKF